jgi:hypothetical protein
MSSTEYEASSKEMPTLIFRDSQIEKKTLNHNNIFPKIKPYNSDCPPIS